MSFRKNYLIIALIVLLASVVTLGAISYVKNNSLPTLSLDVPADEFGKYTFERTMTFDNGRIAEFFESGDEYFRYCHDEQGFVLIRDNNNKTLTYGTLSDGVLISSGVSFFATEQEINLVDKLTASEIDFSLNPSLVTRIDRAAPYGGEVLLQGEQPDIVDQRPLFAGEEQKRTITNMVILIKFNDTPQAVVDNAIAAFDPYFNHPNNSLKNYYEVLSYNNVTINSILPRISPSEVYVYNGGNRQYFNIEDSNTYARRTRETELLSGAVEGAANKFDLSGKDLDINDDGYADSVSFLICGNNEDTWGGLLWPHSWNLDSIDGTSASSYIGGVKIGDYSFNFSSSINVGVLAHEMGHVLGAPDLYHYEYDFVPVGKWDLMSSNTNIPQYMLTYMRSKYIGGIGSSQALDIVTSGIYQLAPVSTSVSNADVLAYKIRLAEKPNEYFMIEYRNPNISTRYDSSLPGTGLVVYRVREPSSVASSTGNRDAKFESKLYPDEVFVFRPLVYMNPDGPSGDIYSDSQKDVERAYLSPQNPYYRSIGKLHDLTKYNYDNLFYSDGDNSKIVIEALSVSSESAQFRVSFPNNKPVIPDGEFDNKIKVNSAVFYNATDWAGIRAEIQFTNTINLSYLANVKVDLLTAGDTVIATNNLNLSDFQAKYALGDRVFDCPFVARDKGNILTSSFYIGSFISETQPAKIRWTVTDAEGKQKTYGPVNVTNGTAYTWQDILNSDAQALARVFAGPQISIGIDNGGNVISSGSATTGIWGINGEEDVSMIAIGRKHLLALYRDMTVGSFGENYYGESVVDSWINVKEIAAGDYTSYALLSDGVVMASGLNDYYQLQVGSWTNIIGIAAGARHIVGVASDGKVYAAGDNSSGQCEVSSITDAIQVAAGDSFTFVLRENGEVLIIGNFPYTVNLSTFSTSVKIAAGSRHILSILENGTVSAAGDNTSGQCNVSGLYDVIDLAGGENQSIFLRVDGVVEYRGTGNPQYETNTPLPNLIYDPSELVAVTSVGTPTLSGGDSRLLKSAEETISVTVSPSGSTYQRVIFTSSDPTVAAITMFAQGTDYRSAKINGLKAGTATITATINGTSIYSSLLVTVYEEKPLTGITLEEETARIIKDKTLTLHYSLVPLDATNVGISTPSFTSGNPQIATVDVASGLVTGVTAGSTTITVSITVSGVTYQDTCAVTVVDSEVTIDVTQSQNPIKIRQNGLINLNYITLKVTITGESQVTIPVTADMLGNYNSAVEGTKTINLTYMGQTKSVYVQVSRYAVKLEFSEMPKTNYIYNDALSNLEGERGEFKVTFSNGAVVNYDVNPSSTTGYNPRTLGAQTLTARFSDPFFANALEIKYTVNVNDIVSSISYSPRQNIYAFGSAFNNTEQLTLNMASSTVRTEDFDSPNVAFTGYNGNIRGQHLLRVTYTDAANGNNVLEADPVVVEVKMAGSFAYEGKDDPNFYHYFEQHDDLNFRVYFDQGSGSRIEIKDQVATPNFWYEMEGFSNELVYVEGFSNTQQSILFTCYTKYSTVVDGNVTTNDRERFEEFNIIARGLKPVTSWEIVIPSGENYVAVDPEEVAEFEYVSGPDAPSISPYSLRIRKTFADSTVTVSQAMETVFDPELVGGVQTYGARYLDTFKEIQIKITDVAQYVLDIPDQTVRYGEALNMTVYVSMKKRGDIPVVPLSYSLEFKNADNSYNTISNYSQRLGVQSVKLTYSFEGTTLTKNFQMEIVDVFSDIEMISPPDANYKYGDPFAPETGLFRMHMRSGAYTDENYGGARFSYSPEFNPTNLTATQVITLRYYNEMEDIFRTWTVNCSVSNYVKSLSIIPAKTEYRYGDPLEVEVRAIYANGANTKLASQSYQHDYDANAIGEQEVLFWFQEGLGTLTVHVSDIVKQITVNQAPEKKVYGYGEAIDYLGMQVTLKYESGLNNKTISGSDIAEELKITYNPTVSGMQSVIVEGYVGGEKTSFTIEVRADDDNTLKGEDSSEIKVKKSNRIIAVRTTNQTLVELNDRFTFADYLTKKITDKNGATLNPLSTRNLRTGDRVVFTNEAGYNVYDFEIQVFGDSNGDGQVSQTDLDSMASRVIAGENKPYIMDFNSDGKSSLTDIVLFARYING